MLDDLVRFHPEDASTLGVEAFAHLTDPSSSAEELAWLRSIAPPEDELDRDALERWRGFQIRYLERDGHANNLELLLLPNAALHHARIHGRDPEPRRRALPAFLRAQRENLVRGARAGLPFDRDVAKAFAEHLLPAAADGTEEPLYRELAAFVAREIVPHATPCARLGAAETRWRLREVMGIEEPIEALLENARRELAIARTRFSSNVADLFAEKPATLEAALAEYRRHVEAATIFARRFMTVPDDLALGFELLPPGVADGAGFTNWPAPLLDRSARGHVLVSPDLSKHVSVSTKQLAVHEAIPGHYLQSAIWQRSNLAPIRFLGIADDVAMSRGYFGTMLAVEGWAVFVERLFFANGFYDAREETFFALCEAIRAMRVIVDLELHATDKPLDELIAFASDATHLSRGWAEAQLLRARRMPLQQLTYLVGAVALEGLSRAPDRLLAHGPVPPSRLADLA